jgi:hypothetical protein
MNFRPELAEAVVLGEKTETRRVLSTNPRSPWYSHGCGFKVGKDYAVCPGRGKAAIGRIKIEKTFQQLLGEIDLKSAIAEGVESVEDYFALFERINGHLDKQLRVWVIRFSLVTP